MPPSEKGGTISTAKPYWRAGRRQEFRRAGAAPAEMEIEADHDRGDREALDQDLPHEILGRQTRQRRIETHDDRPVEARHGEQPQLGGLVAQPEYRLVRPEDGARMRLEGQHDGLAPERAGARQRHVDDGAVAAVDAFEIADRDHGALEGVVARRSLRYFAANDDEGRPGRRSVDHGR